MTWYELEMSEQRRSSSWNVMISKNGKECMPSPANLFSSMFDHPPHLRQGRRTTVTQPHDLQLQQASWSPSSGSRGSSRSHSRRSQRDHSQELVDQSGINISNGLLNRKPPKAVNYGKHAQRNDHGFEPPRASFDSRAGVQRGSPFYSLEEQPRMSLDGRMESFDASARSSAQDMQSFFMGGRDSPSHRSQYSYGLDDDDLMMAQPRRASVDGESSMYMMKASGYDSNGSSGYSNNTKGNRAASPRSFEDSKNSASFSQDLNKSPRKKLPKPPLESSYKLGSSNHRSYVNTLEYNDDTNINGFMPGRHSIDVIRDSPRFSFSVDSPAAANDRDERRASCFDYKEAIRFAKRSEMEAPPRLSFDGSDIPRSILELRKAIEKGLIDGSMDQFSNADSSSKAPDAKKSSKPSKTRKLPSIVARLMGLDDLPSTSSATKAKAKRQPPPATSSSLKPASTEARLLQGLLQIKPAGQDDSPRKSIDYRNPASSRSSFTFDEKTSCNEYPAPYPAMLPSSSASSPRDRQPPYTTNDRLNIVRAASPPPSNRGLINLPPKHAIEMIPSSPKYRERRLAQDMVNYSKSHPNLAKEVTERMLSSTAHSHSKNTSADPFHDEIEKRLRQLGLQSSEAERKTLKQILEAMHLKGLLRQPPSMKNDHANNTKPRQELRTVSGNQSVPLSSPSTREMLMESFSFTLADNSPIPHKITVEKAQDAQGFSPSHPRASNKKQASSFCQNHPKNRNEAPIVIMKPLAKSGGNSSEDERPGSSLSEVTTGSRSQSPTGMPDSSRKEKFQYSLQSYYEYELKLKDSQQQYQLAAGDSIATTSYSTKKGSFSKGSVERQSRKAMLAENYLPFEMDQRRSRHTIKSMDKASTSDENTQGSAEELGEDMTTHSAREDSLVNNTDHEEEEVKYVIGSAISGHAIESSEQRRRNLRQRFSALEPSVQMEDEDSQENSDFVEDDLLHLKVHSHQPWDDNTDTYPEMKFRLSQHKAESQSLMQIPESTDSVETHDQRLSAKINVESNIIDLGQRSPVSVLDAQAVVLDSQVSDEACSMETIKLCVSDSQGEAESADIVHKSAGNELRRRRIREHRNMWNDNTEFKYMKDIFTGAGLLVEGDEDLDDKPNPQCADLLERWQVYEHSFDPELYSTLEKRWERVQDEELQSNERANDVDFGRELYIKSRQEALGRRLLFDSVEELLSKQLLLMYSTSSMQLQPRQLGKTASKRLLASSFSASSSSCAELLMEIWGEVQAIHPCLSPAVDKSGKDDIHSILDKDLAHWWLDPWTDVGGAQLSELAEDVEALIIADLMEELSAQL